MNDHPRQVEIDALLAQERDAKLSGDKMAELVATESLLLILSYDPDDAKRIAATRTGRLRLVQPGEPGPASPPLPLEEHGWDADIPPDALPAVARDICSEIQRIRGGPLALSASMAMGVLSTLVQGKVRYRLTPTWTEEACIYWLVFTPPSAAKSTSTKPILAPLLAHQAEQRKVIESTRHLTMARRKGIEARLAQLGKQAALGKENERMPELEEDGTPKWGQRIDPGGPREAKLEMAKLARELDRIPAPIVPELTRKDINPQMLSKRLALNQLAMGTSYASLGILSSEPAFLENLKGRHSGGTPILETVLGSYDGESIQEDRAGENGTIVSSTVDKPLLTIVCQGQPDVLAGLLEVDSLRSRGFWSRCIVHNLPDTASWAVSNERIDSDTEARWNATVRRLATWLPNAPVEIDLSFLSSKVNELYRVAEQRCKGHPEQAARAKRAACKALRFIGLELLCEQLGSIVAVDAIVASAGGGLAGGAVRALEDKLTYLYNIFYPPVSIRESGTGPMTDAPTNPHTHGATLTLSTMKQLQQFGVGRTWATRDLLMAMHKKSAWLAPALEELEEAGYVEHDPKSMRRYRGALTPKRYKTINLGEPAAVPEIKAQREPGED